MSWQALIKKKWLFPIGEPKSSRPSLTRLILEGNSGKESPEGQKSSHLNEGQIENEKDSIKAAIFTLWMSHHLNTTDVIFFILMLYSTNAEGLSYSLLKMLNKVCLKSCRKEKILWLDLGNLEPAAIRFTLERLQKSTRRSGIFSLLFSCIYIHKNSREWLIIFKYP